MYLKIVGSMFLIVSTGMIGCLKAEELDERVSCLREFKRMMVFLQGELRFHKAALPEAFENVSKRIGEPFSTFLMELSKRLESKSLGGFEDAWKEMSEELLRKEGFRKEDKRLLETLGGSLGYLDLAMQTETLNLAILQTEESLRHAKEQQQVKGKLYRTMGIASGAFLILLVV